MKPMCLVFGTNLGTEESLVVIHVSVEKLKYEQKGDFHNFLWCVLSQARTNLRDLKARSAK